MRAHSHYTSTTNHTTLSINAVVDLFFFRYTLPLLRVLCICVVPHRHVSLCIFPNHVRKTMCRYSDGWFFSNFFPSFVQSILFWFLVRIWFCKELKQQIEKNKRLEWISRFYCHRLFASNIYNLIMTLFMNKTKNIYISMYKIHFMALCIQHTPCFCIKCITAVVLFLWIRKKSNNKVHICIEGNNVHDFHRKTSKVKAHYLFSTHEIHWPN